MTGPGNDRGRLRASHDDRDRVIEVLKSAFVQGRLVKDELDERVGGALASRTYAELAALTEDIPARPAPLRGPAAPLRGPAGPRERPQGRPRSKGMVALAIAVGFIAPLIVLVAVLTGNDQLGEVFTMPAVFTFMAWLIALAQVLDTRHSRRARGRRQPQPAPHGDGPRQPRPARRGGVVWL